MCVCVCECDDPLLILLIIIGGKVRITTTHTLPTPMYPGMKQLTSDGGGTGSCAAMQLSSIPELFYKLCESVLSHSLQTSSSILDLSFRQTFVDREKLPLLAKKLRLRCMDVVLLRKWEWMGTETHCITDALGFTLDLYCHGEPFRAKKLTSAVHWMLEDASELMESESILQFLCLLSSPKISKGTHGPTTRGDHIYHHYPRYVCVILLNL